MLKRQQSMHLSGIFMAAQLKLCPWLKPKFFGQIHQLYKKQQIS